VVGSLVAHATAFGDKAEWPIQKALGLEESGE